MTPETFSVVPCQYELTGASSVEDLCGRAENLIATAGGADVYVLPELFVVDATSGSGESVAEYCLDESETETFHAWCGRVATEHDAVVVGGTYYVDDDGIRNRCPVATPDGDVLTYDKRHPIPSEREEGVLAGEEEPPLVDHQGVTVAPLVCYDVEFPSDVRGVVERGAEVLAVPSWTAATDGYQRVRRCAAARAVENQAYVVQTSLVGTHPREGISEATGRSTVFAPCDDIVGPHGTRLSLPRDESAVAGCTLDVEALRESRKSATVRPYTDAREEE